MHDQQITIEVDTVRELIADQFPDWAGLPVGKAGREGTVNAIFRIGEGVAARFPLRPGEADAVRRGLKEEAEATRLLLAATRFAVPKPLGIGDPGAGYPLPWSVQTWLPGTTASRDDVSGSLGFADDLATLVEEIRAIEVGGRTFSGRGRGGDLTAHDGWMETCFEESRELLDVPRLRRIWLRLRDLPRESPNVMTHGDLIPGNLLVDEGRLAGVLDAGGLGPADPALDLVGAWHLFERGPRQRFRNRLGCHDLDWDRGKAWAFEQAMGVVWYYRHSNEPMSRMGHRTLGRIVADESDG